MKRGNAIASLAVLVALIGLVVAVFIFLRPGSAPRPSVGQAPEATEAPEAAAPQATPRSAEAVPPAAPEKDAAPEAASPQSEEQTGEGPTPSDEKTEKAPAPAQEKAGEAPSPSQDKTEAGPASRRDAAEDTDQPSFDIVRIEPTGEGVLAGRAEPGWKVTIQSRGMKVAEVEADDQGEWTAILEKPLDAGAHDLSLKATSPDGTEERASKQSVSAEVTVPTRKSALPEATPRLATPAAQPARQARPGAAPPPAARPVETTIPPAPRPVGPETVAAEDDVTPGRVAPGEASPLPQTASVEEGREAAPAALPPQTTPGTYTILPGDTLWDIAQRYLGAGWRYKTIYRDNRTIIRNPNLIYPEQKMTIAEPPSGQN